MGHPGSSCSALQTEDRSFSDYGENIFFPHVFCSPDDETLKYTLEKKFFLQSIPFITAYHDTATKKHKACAGDSQLVISC